MTCHPMVSENTGETTQDVADVAAIETSEELSVSIPTLHLDPFNRSIFYSSQASQQEERSSQFQRSVLLFR
jgi:hypothetical protein